MGLSCFEGLHKWVHDALLREEDVEERKKADDFYARMCEASSLFLCSQAGEHVWEGKMVGGFHQKTRENLFLFLCGQQGEDVPDEVSLALCRPVSLIVVSPRGEALLDSKFFFLLRPHVVSKLHEGFE